MMFFFYNLVLLALSPAIAVYILYRIFVSGKSKKSWRQQLGFVRLPLEIRDTNRVWIHAVSVGESVASAAVVSELKRVLNDTAVVMSTTTQTGQEMAYKSVKELDGIFYYPFDLAPSVLLSLARVRPAVFATTDTEIWPNFLHIARKRGVKTAMINGTVSDKTLSGARKIPWLYKWAMSNIDVFCMQSQADADRVISIGADPSRVIVTGNCKADQAVIPMSNEEKNKLRNQFKCSDTNRIFVAGSTNPGEDSPVLDAFIAAKNTCSELKLIIAPRQIERRDEIRSLVQEKGLRCGYRSSFESISTDTDVIILDTFGELAKVYAIADVSFVGGSIIPRGCHSILQPISQGKPVFFGPYTFKAKDLVAQAKSNGVGFEIKNGKELGCGLIKMLADRSMLEDIKVRCDKMMADNLGASRRTADALVQIYEEYLASREV